tara:strand:+ start:141 stop:860 length:720 start_codon:yes stop_codon:yes gene_type:complete
MTKSKNGFILFEGPSEIDGAPIVVIGTGFDKRSANTKTGNMIQTWIIRNDIEPHRAIKEGKDFSICGDCKLRGDGAGKKRACYVIVHNAPLSVYRSYVKGNYEKASTSDLESLGSGHMIRLGSYGDPAAVPLRIWSAITKNATGFTGYTHRWKLAPKYKVFTMASADTEKERAEAIAMGWRTFRVKHEGEPVLAGEVICPATTVGLSCAACMSCRGTSGSLKSTIVIDAHGSGKKYLAA